jgi:hypothetical protein
LSDTPLWKYLPQLQGAYLHDFTRAYEAHLAAGEILRLANASLPEMAEDAKARRKMLLEIPFNIIVDERNKALDAFVVGWLRHRGGNFDPAARPSAVGGGDTKGT